MRTVRKEVPHFLTKFSEGIDTANRVGANVETFTRDITGRDPESQLHTKAAFEARRAAPVTLHSLSDWHR